MTIIDNITKYLIDARAHRAIKKEVKMSGEAGAVWAMFQLNRYAFHIGRCEQKLTIYALKRHLIQCLYEKYPHTIVSVTQQRQQVPCHHYLQEDDETECPTCHDSGTWPNLLYLFTFRIGTTVYKWHQPQNQVDYPVSASSEITEYEKALNQDRVLVLYPRQRMHAMRIVHEFLIQNSYQPVTREPYMPARLIVPLSWKMKFNNLMFKIMRPREFRKYNQIPF